MTTVTRFVILLTILLVASPVAAQFKDGNKELGITPGGKAAFVDYNNDGDLDLATAGKTVNRSAIGVIARIKLKDRVLTRQVASGTGEGNHNQVRLHFGLGAHEGPFDVQITWPGGGKQLCKGLDAGEWYKMTFK